MKISQTGIDIVKHFEGLYLTAYLCPAGVWTIGYGHTGKRHNDGSVRRGRKITKEEAEALLAEDLNTKYGPAVQRLVKAPLAQHEFDALVSFHFNTGALGKSTLLRLLNAGDKVGAAAQFDRWTRGGGKVLAGLIRRRRAEKRLFQSGVLDFS